MYTSRSVLAHEEIRTRQGMVVAQHPLGAEVGLDVLKRGGNAVDAAVTTAFCMGVLQPLMNGIGGGGQMIVRLGNGYDTVLQQRGGNLSMGQRQLVSMARAMGFSRLAE